MNNELKGDWGVIGHKAHDLCKMRSNFSKLSRSHFKVNKKLGDYIDCSFNNSVINELKDDVNCSLNILKNQEVIAKCHAKYFRGKADDLLRAHDQLLLIRIEFATTNSEVSVDDEEFQNTWARGCENVCDLRATARNYTAVESKIFEACKVLETLATDLNAQVSSEENIWNTLEECLHKINEAGELAEYYAGDYRARADDLYSATDYHVKRMQEIGFYKEKGDVQ